jgi:hypothetical protein
MTARFEVPMPQRSWETMTVKLDLKNRGGAKKLARLIEQGWEVVNRQDKSLLSWGHKSLLVLRRER